MIGWTNADGSPETPELPLMSKSHCSLRANAVLFRKHPKSIGADGKYDRKGKRLGKGGPRARLCQYVRTLVRVSSFDAKKTLGHPDNKPILEELVDRWEKHWFWGAVLSTDRTYWEKHRHDDLDDGEEGETPTSYVNGVLRNIRAAYNRDMRKKDCGPTQVGESAQIKAEVNVVSGTHSVVHVTNTSNTQAPAVGKIVGAGAQVHSHVDSMNDGQLMGQNDGDIALFQEFMAFK